MDELTISSEDGAAPPLDLVALAAEPDHHFLRAAWFAAASADAPLTTLVARRATGEPVAALPLRERKAGPLKLGEVAGSYWPFRSFPISRELTDDELIALLTHPAARARLGTAWRLGPVYADDPTVARLLGVSRASGWAVLTRKASTCYVIDLARLRAAGQWPSVARLQKNRRLERRLADIAPVEFRTFPGKDMNADVLDALGEVERESWVAGAGGDTKFLDSAMRRTWEGALADPVIAGSLACSLLYVGDAPAAFTFTLSAGKTLHCIANGYSERFAQRSPGKLLLFREFEAAADRGVERISWGAGDGGYKGQMGAEPGPEILDLLFVRNPALAALLKPLWTWRRG